jgi:preprotein translocase subunit YajC
MFITPAMAQDASPGGSNFLIQLLPFILIFAIMYLLIIRPQQKRLKAHREMVAGIKRGDTVVTAGGLIGKVARVVDDYQVEVDLASDVRVNVVRATLSEVHSREDARAAEKARLEARRAEAEAVDDVFDDELDDAEAPAAEANGASRRRTKAAPARKPARTAPAKPRAAASARSGASKTAAAKPPAKPRRSRANAKPASQSATPGDSNEA